MRSVSQSLARAAKIAVADKKLYALRDVTATVGCIPLIASSIMSKKLAAGSDAILLDVTMGSGAFMKNLDEAVELARLMVSIGTAHGRKVAALITEHFGNADAVPQPPERCLSRKAGIMRCCLKRKAPARTGLHKPAGRALLLDLSAGLNGCPYRKGCLRPWGPGSSCW